MEDIPFHAKAVVESLAALWRPVVEGSTVCFGSDLSMAALGELCCGVLVA